MANSVLYKPFWELVHLYGVMQSPYKSNRDTFQHN